MDLLNSIKNMYKVYELLPSQDSSKYLTGMQESSNIRTALKPILLSRTQSRNPNLITKIITRMEMKKL